MSDLNKLNQVFDTIKNAAIAAVGLFALSLVSVVLVRSFSTSDITFDSVKVPESFVALGYTSEITSTQILDEIAKIHELSVPSNINKKSIGGGSSGDNLTRLASLPGASGIDFKSIQALIQETFGIRKERILGEITGKQTGEETHYHVRIRALPENKLLVNFTEQVDIPTLIKDIALKLVERLEPTVAAAYYRLNKDQDNALRMLDEALGDDDDSDDLIALVQRASVFAQQGKYELAQADLNRAFTIEAKSPQAQNVQSFLFNQQKKYSHALEYAKMELESWPDRWNPFANMAAAYAGLGHDAEAQRHYLKAIALNPRGVVQYQEAAVYFIAKGEAQLAEGVLDKGLKKFPTDVSLLLTYSTLMIKLGKFEFAARTLAKAMKIEPDNRQIWVAVTQLPFEADPGLRKDVDQKIAGALQANPQSGMDALLSSSKSF